MTLNFYGTAGTFTLPVKDLRKRSHCRILKELVDEKNFITHFRESPLLREDGYKSVVERFNTLRESAKSLVGDLEQVKLKLAEDYAFLFLGIGGLPHPSESSYLSARHAYKLFRRNPEMLTERAKPTKINVGSNLGAAGDIIIPTPNINIAEQMTVSGAPTHRDLQNIIGQNLYIRTQTEIGVDRAGFIPKRVSSPFESS